MTGLGVRGGCGLMEVDAAMVRRDLQLPESVEALMDDDVIRDVTVELVDAVGRAATEAALETGHWKARLTYALGFLLDAAVEAIRAGGERAARVRDALAGLFGTNCHNHLAQFGRFLSHNARSSDPTECACEERGGEGKCV